MEKFSIWHLQSDGGEFLMAYTERLKFVLEEIYEFMGFRC